MNFTLIEGNVKSVIKKGLYVKKGLKPTMKCFKCKEEHDRSYFIRNSVCPICVLTLNKQYYNEHKEELKKKRELKKLK